MSRPPVKKETDAKAQSNPARHFNGETPEKSRVLYRVNQSFARAREAGKMAAFHDLGGKNENQNVEENGADALAAIFQNSGDTFQKSKKQNGNRHVFWSDGPASGQTSTADRASPGFVEGNKSVTSYGGV